MNVDPDPSPMKFPAKTHSRRHPALNAVYLRFATLTGLSGLEMHDAVMKGIPISVVRNVIRSFKILSPTEIRTVLGVSEATLRRRANSTLDANASDRTVRLLAVAELATKVLGARTAAERWLAASAIGLDRRRPIDLLASSEGTDMVKTLLTRMEHGIYS